MSERLKCLICGKMFLHLGSHIWHKHKILAKEYKMEFGLDINHALIAPSVKLKKQIAFEEDREKYLKNLIKCGKKYQFKKGEQRRDYFSDESLEKANKNLEIINARVARNCPVCNLKTKHLESHLFNAHRLVLKFV